jgi:hypothetical protein
VGVCRAFGENVATLSSFPVLSAAQTWILWTEASL